MCRFWHDLQKVAIEKPNANQQMCRFWHNLQKVAIEKPNANQQMCRFWHDFNNFGSAGQIRH